MSRCLRRIVVCLPVALAAAAAGCLQAYNPTYFPHFGIQGDIQQTHAKPGGRAYFKNFDPFACRIDLTPGRCSNPTGTQQVLIATVVDRDGKPRRSRRVEWVLDGPGHIIEVDESGYFSGRGYKVDNKYAVSYTDYREHTLTRGNDDPRDDFTIYPGQTWCVVSCAVPGETVVTAYAPEVFDWGNGRTTARLAWTDARFDFPAPTVSRTGGEVTLLTAVATADGGKPADGLKVRYRVLDGPPAVLVGRSGAGTTGVLSGAGSAEAEVPAGADGKAAVRVVQSDPRAGTTRIAVEVVGPDPDKPGTEKVIGRQDAVVEWATPQLTLDLTPPAAVAVGREVRIPLAVANAGKADSQPVTVRAVLPDGAEFVRADPPPTARTGPNLTWALGPVAGGKSGTVELVVKPTRLGPLTVVAEAETPETQAARREVTVGVGEGGLKVAVAVPPRAGVGDKLTARVTVTNPGAVPLDGATAWVGFDGGLSSADGRNPLELAVGAVPAGQSKTVEVPLTAAKSGPAKVRANVAADGGLADRAEAAVEVRRAELTVSVSGPDRLAPGDRGTWEVTVANAGDGPAADVVVRAELPAGLTARVNDRSPDGGPEWAVGTIAAGERKTVRFVATADRPLDAATVRVTAASGGRTASADAAVTVAGQPALALQLSQPTGQVPVGRRGAIRLTVKNRGTGPARRVEVSLSGSGELELRGGTGPSGDAGPAADRRLTFPVVEEIPPGGSAVFVADVEAASAGRARLTAEVRSDHLSQPLRDEQTVRVVAGGP